MDYKYSPHLFTACIFGTRVISTLAISQSERLQVPLQDGQRAAPGEPNSPSPTAAGQERHSREHLATSSHLPGAKGTRGH